MSALLTQFSNLFFLTDGGSETNLIFHKGYILPEFASFPLIENKQGRADLTDYFQQYLDIAKYYQMGYILESPTWRASKAWGERLGYSEAKLKQLNFDSIEFLSELKTKQNTDIPPILISGCIGPHTDGYFPNERLTPRQSYDYHLAQIHSLAKAGADLITAHTIAGSDEAIGIVQAANNTGIPVVISFTTEINGLLSSGEHLEMAIQAVDSKTQQYPEYFMINCAHPTHFESALPTDVHCCERIQGIRANASTLSHAELNESKVLDDGNPCELATQYYQLLNQLPNLRVLGGCCGTDHRHISAIAEAFSNTAS